MMKDYRTDCLSSASDCGLCWLMRKRAGEGVWLCLRHIIYFPGQVADDVAEFAQDLPQQTCVGNLQGVI